MAPSPRSLPAPRDFGKLFALLLLILAVPGYGATRVVTQLGDSGPGSLRAILATAEAGDTVVFAPELFSSGEAATLSLSSGPLRLDRDLALEGPGDLPGGNEALLTISGPGTFGILEIAPPRPGGSVEVSISGLGFSGGLARNGGAVLIRKGARVSIQGCDFIANLAFREGGALHNAGELMVDECRFRANEAGQNGGALFNLGRAQVTRSLFADNVAGFAGGGIAAQGGELWLESSTVTGNHAMGGGGVAIFGTRAREANAVLQACTVTANHARFFGGGLFARGGGEVLALGNSIVAGNTSSPNLRRLPDNLASWFRGAIVSDGHNLIGGGTPMAAPRPSDQIGKDPLLGPLTWAGGRTETHPLLPLSPARDAAAPDFAGVAVETDQRGFPRVVNERADVGAYEFAAATLVCPGVLAFECVEGGTPTGVLEVELFAPDFAEAHVTWSVNAVTRLSTTVALAEGSPTTPLVFNGPFPLGRNTVEVSVLFGEFELQCATEVIVGDGLPPTITLRGPHPLLLQCGETYEEFGAVAHDACGGELALSIDASAVKPGVPGVYFVTYTATDASGRTASAQRLVDVVDETPPVLVGTVPSSLTFALTEAGACSHTLEDLPFALDASDGCDPAPRIRVERWSATEGFVPVLFPLSLPLGTTTLAVSARDHQGNRSPRQSFAVEVKDEAPPALSLLGDALLSWPLGVPFVDPGVLLADDCSGPVELVTEVNGAVGAALDVCRPGTHEILYTATDASGNVASVARLVEVRSTVSLAGPETPIVLAVVETDCARPLALDTVVTLGGVPTTCDSLNVDVRITTPNGTPHHPALDEIFPFPVGTSSVRITVWIGGTDPIPLAETEFTVRVEDPHYACVPNVIWPLALPLNTPLVDAESRTRAVFFQQVLAKPGESRWYKIQAPAGGQVRVFLENLPADYNVVVYSDIARSYEDLLALADSPDENAQLLALLGAEFAPEAYAPEAYSPEAYSPEAYAPEAYSPEAYSPEAYSPEAYSPEAYSPEAYAPEAYSPEAYSPEAYSPEAYSPEAYSPEAYSPEAYSPEAYSPEAYSPEAYSPEAYASAQQRSLVAFSSAPGTTAETVIFNTFSRAGDFYIRVRGRNGIAVPGQPFDLLVEIEGALCEGVEDIDTETTAPPTVTGTPTSLLVWDSSRIPGTAEEVEDLGDALASFALAANGWVLDLATDARVNALQAQADAHPACPYAKNLVAEAIRARILAHRAAAPSLADVTLLGGDNVIPFFRTNDEAGLASEANYFPPVLDATHSQSSLRLGQVLTQDRYGSVCQVFLATGPYDLPEIPIGRLVERATEISAYLALYEEFFDGRRGLGGVLPAPASGLSVGYDFLADSAEAMGDEMRLGLGSGGTVHELIVPFELPPSLGWTADDLRAALLVERRDLIYLAAHFSTSGTLAADYATRLSAGEVAASAVDFEGALIFSSGCHSGYNTVDSHAVPFVTEQPDWAQAFARKGAIWIAGTGYQYGDTDFIEYTERLLIETMRALRADTGPVSVGEALVAAKQRYLAETPLMRGIHEKTLVQVILYGLPMMRLDLPGERLPVVARDVDLSSVASLDGPGAAFALKRGTLDVVPSLTRIDQRLEVVGEIDVEVIASFWEGSGGIVSLPGEPVRARETFNLSRPADGLVRGIAFRGGTYTDIAGFRPLTGAPATETRGVHGAFLSEVFYPQRPWHLNQIGELCDLDGASLLHVFPIQYRSPDLTSDVGIARRFDTLELEVFYCPVRGSAALANPVAINLVRSEVEAGTARFAVEVAISGEVGVQNVWITYTGEPGSPSYGAWTSVDLTPPESGNQAGLWEGMLELAPGENPADLRFIVQAVNAVGVTTLNTNFGRYFTLATSTLDGVGVESEPVTLSLEADESFPTEGAYRALLPVAARLTTPEGGAIAGATVTFSLGPINLPATTDAEGRASLLLPLDVRPGTYQLRASFAGDDRLGRAADRRAFTIVKAPTGLRILPGPDSRSLRAELRALDGTPLKERSLLFVLRDASGFFARPAITDGAGQALLTGADLPDSLYTVEAFFGQTVELTPEVSVPLTDPLYGPSEAVGALLAGDALALWPTVASAYYGDGNVPGVSSHNQGLSDLMAEGGFALRVPGVSLNDLLEEPASSFVALVVPPEDALGPVLRLRLETRLSGRELVGAPVELRPFGDEPGRWRGTVPVGEDGSAIVELIINPDNLTGRFRLLLRPSPSTGPLFHDKPPVLEFTLELFAPGGETVASGRIVIGADPRPWSHEKHPFRAYYDLTGEDESEE
jgi:hypothetical protein